jgi:hypothetical protein
LELRAAAAAAARLLLSVVEGISLGWCCEEAGRAGGFELASLLAMAAAAVGRIHQALGIERA